jgi:3-hydroxybutyryl-CoA dehydratase
MRVLENITYDELRINDYATFSKTLSDENLVLFAASNGDLPLSALTVEAAEKKTYDSAIGYGMWASSLISTAFDKVIPGPGSIYLDQNLSFKQKVELGDTLTVKLTVIRKLENHRVLFQCDVQNQDGEVIVSGESTVIAPIDKVSLDQASLPRIHIKD